METQYKLAVRSAQLLAKDAPPDEAARVMATMATAKSQLSKVGIVSLVWFSSWETVQLMPFGFVLEGHFKKRGSPFNNLCCRAPQVRERCPPLVRECHVLMPLLEEMEKHITAFYQALDRAARITSEAGETSAQSRQRWQVRRDDGGREL